MPKKDANRLVWIDLEMTGLEPDQHVIIEVATLITDAHLEVVAEGPNLAIRRSDEELALMDGWNVKTHTQSGLLRRMQEEGVDIAEAERQTLAFVRRWVRKSTSPLAGNSIAQDRRFLRREMPALDAYLHYRNVDVSTVKELVRRWYPALKAPDKRQAHRALEDIHESVAELRWYREHVFRPAAEVTPPAEAPAAEPATPAQEPEAS